MAAEETDVGIIDDVVDQNKDSEEFKSDLIRSQLPLSAEVSSHRIMGILNGIQKLAQLVSDVNGSMGPLLLVDFGHLILVICALVFLPLKKAEGFEWNDALVLAGNAMLFTIRLILLTICLGDVYPAGVEVNTRMAKFMTSQAASLHPRLFTPILAHLSVFSANPVSFNAWGFFPITRGTLLATLSLISTYIVVLLQAK